MEHVLNGSDLVLIVDGKAIGHCTSHTINLTTETRDLVFKPVATKGAASSKFKNKEVTGVACGISFEGLVFTGETEATAGKLAAALLAGKPVEVKSYRRGDSGVGTDAVPFLTGSFIVSSLTIGAPAEDSTTYNGQLDNSGEFTFDDTKLDTAV